MQLIAGPELRALIAQDDADLQFCNRGIPDPAPRILPSPRSLGSGTQYKAVCVCDPALQVECLQQTFCDAGRRREAAWVIS